jgi:hypothetical protein
MRLLVEQPGIAVIDHYPFELRHAVALVHELLATASPALRSDAAGAVSRLLAPQSNETSGDPYFSIEFPHFEWLANDLFRTRVHHTQQLIEELYDEVDRQSGTASIYFAEKFVADSVRCALNHLYAGARTVLLVRDPRDVALSQLSFNEQRGFEGFGPPGDDVVERACRVAAAQVASLETIDDADGNRFLAVRYEDLVANPADALRRLLDLLDIEADSTELDEMVAAAASDHELRMRHMTADDSDSSIGRWRRELTSEQSAAIEMRAGDQLERLGYFGN